MTGVTPPPEAATKALSDRARCSRLLTAAVLILALALLAWVLAPFGVVRLALQITGLLSFFVLWLVGAGDALAGLRALEPRPPRMVVPLVVGATQRALGVIFVMATKLLPGAPSALSKAAPIIGLAIVGGGAFLIIASLGTAILRAPTWPGGGQRWTGALLLIGASGVLASALARIVSPSVTGGALGVAVAAVGIGLSCERTARALQVASKRAPRG